MKSKQTKFLTELSQFDQIAVRNPMAAHALFIHCEPAHKPSNPVTQFIQHTGQIWYNGLIMPYKSN